MNKQQFLLELSQYLTFVSPEERDLVIEEYSAKFDEVGAEGEAGLILQLGTPMMIAIGLKRKKEAGEQFTQRAADIRSKMSGVQAEHAEESLDSEPEPVSQELFYQSELTDSETDSEDSDESADEDTNIPPAKARVKGSAVLSCVVLSILAVILGLAVISVGTYLVVVMGNLLVVALQSLSVLSDALLLFAGALVSGGIGVVIVWLGLWSAIRIISGQVKRVRS